MSRVVEPGECTCECHGNESAMHMVPCCSLCPTCHRNIAFGYEQHTKACAEEFEKLLAEEHERELAKKGS